MQKVIVLFFSAAILLLSGCDKSLSFEEQLAVDKELIKTYLDINQITTAIETNSGLTYFVTQPGNGSDMPIATDEVTVNYKGYYLEGGVFDPGGGAPLQFFFNQVIPGWGEAIQLMKKNEKTTFLIPSYLAYGTAGRGSIPPNTVLVFDIELLDF